MPADSRGGTDWHFWAACGASKRPIIAVYLLRHHGFSPENCLDLTHCVSDLPLILGLFSSACRNRYKSTNGHFTAKGWLFRKQYVGFLFAHCWLHFGRESEQKRSTTVSTAVSSATSGKISTAVATANTTILDSPSGKLSFFLFFFSIINIGA